MGYPLKNSLIYSFLELLYILQTRSHSKDSRFYHQDVTRILTHPYIVDCCGKEAKRFADMIVSKRMISIEESLFADHALLSRIFVKRVEWQALGAYMLDILDIIMQHMPADEHMQREHLRIASEEITKTIHSIERCDITISADIFHSLLRRHLQTITIPYEGKPLEGIQILGILETRNIDFKNVIILSMTDANFPGNRTDQASFIPYSLRLAYDMPTPEQHEAMYAYYFYRLLQRAKRVEMLYCSRADDKSTGECSRYIYQLDFESPYNIDKHTVGVDLNVEDRQPIEVAKGEYEMVMLGRYMDDNTKHSLSPTALHSYVRCPLSFYFKYIAKLKSRNELTDKIDASTLGDILHKAMETLYAYLEHKPNPMADIVKLQNVKLIEEAVDKAISNKMFNDKPISINDYSGDTLLVRDILVKYILRGIMRYDVARTGFTITGLERDIAYRHTSTAGQSIKLSGRADRIDTLPDGTMQIIDYKSGQGSSLIYPGIEKLFHGTDAERLPNVFQTLLYSMMLHKQTECDVTPSLYYASKMLSTDYSPLIIEKINLGGNKSETRIIERYSMVAKEFESQLSAMLDELFDQSIPFRQAEDPNTCNKCDYKEICRR
jgi:CRISPR/Cas system-associated exonuclease Cas4 (RecB family)